MWARWPDPVPLPFELERYQWFKVRITVQLWRVTITINTGAGDIQVFDKNMLEPKPIQAIMFRVGDDQPKFTGEFVPYYPSGGVGFRQSWDERTNFRNVYVKRMGYSPNSLYEYTGRWS